MSTQHAQEGTAYSLTDTFLPSAFSGSILMSPNPDFIQGYDTRHPMRSEKAIDPRLTPETIPPEHPHRTLILCFDGTGDQFDGDNSNIVFLVSLLKKDDRSKQMVYYQTGIGTYTSPQVMNPFMTKVKKTLDVMFAWSLDAHVMSGYEFLMQNYTEGDKICIFGFSRGAYTARSLAGMIHKVGLLPADNYQQVPFAYKMYTETDAFGWEQSDAFKATFSIDVDIEFLGVWDTVDSVGFTSRRLPFTTSNTIVRTFRHALSLDERRAKFKANLWNRPTHEEEQLGAHDESRRQPRTSSPLAFSVKELDRLHPVPRSPTLRTPRESEQERKLIKLERIYSQKERHPTDIEEVWFSGCHSDVGGGSVPNKTRHSLARISLRWMVRECFKANTGIMFDSQALRGIGLDPSTLYPYVTLRPPPVSARSEAYRKRSKPTFTQRISSIFKNKETKTKRGPLARANGHGNMAGHGNIDNINEEFEDLQDALSPVYDQLKISRIWWALEVIPSNIRFQNADNEWITYFSSNLARPRIIPSQNGVIKVHRTVQLRMEANPPAESKRRRHYTPRARFSVEPTWID